MGIEGTKMVSLEERFWSKVNIQGPDQCWMWSAKRARGYGSFWVNNSTRVAHKMAYEFIVGPVPEGMELDHLCHSQAYKRGECKGGESCIHRACVNPNHMEAVSRKVNLSRGPHRNAMKTQCPRGHPYDSVINTAAGPRRRCKRCHSERERRRQKRKRMEICSLTTEEVLDG